VPGAGGKAAATTGWSTGRTRARRASTWSPAARHSTGAEGSTSTLGTGTRREASFPASEKERIRREPSRRRSARGSEGTAPGWAGRGKT
jgi:hypothetical protein